MFYLIRPKFEKEQQVFFSENKVEQVAKQVFSGSLLKVSQDAEIDGPIMLSFTKSHSACVVTKWHRWTCVLVLSNKKTCFHEVVDGQPLHFL